MFYRQYYSELGKLLYAFAGVDGSISQKEKDAMKELVRKELVPAEKHTDKFGTDAAYYTEMEFDILEDSLPDPQAAFDSFLYFVEQHHTAIDSHMREATLRVAAKFADAYYKTSKKEKELLGKLKEKLESLPVKN